MPSLEQAIDDYKNNPDWGVKPTERETQSMEGWDEDERS